MSTMQLGPIGKRPHIFAVHFHQVLNVPKNIVKAGLNQGRAVLLSSRDSTVLAVLSC
jgi:hypothetical protein